MVRRCCGIIGTYFAFYEPNPIIKLMYLYVLRHLNHYNVNQT